MNRFATLLRIGFAENVAYRGEFVVWFLSTNMPLIMLLLWRSVAAEAPFGRFGSKEFTAYFLIVQIVRLLTGSWVIWQMNFEVQQGALSARLLRPVHPFVSYAAEHLSAQPLRLAICLPIAIIAGWVVGAGGFSHDPIAWVIFPLSVFLAWALNFSSMLIIGSAALFWGSSRSLSDLWLGPYFVLSGYIVPIELFPPWLQHAVAFTPFPYLLAFPVETALGLHSRAVMLQHFAAQMAYVLGATVVAFALWARGVSRFEAFGG